MARGTAAPAVALRFLPRAAPPPEALPVTAFHGKKPASQHLGTGQAAHLPVVGDSDETVGRVITGDQTIQDSRFPRFCQCIQDALPVLGLYKAAGHHRDKSRPRLVLGLSEIKRPSQASGGSRVGWASRPPVWASRLNELSDPSERPRRKMRRSAGKMPTLPETANRSGEVSLFMTSGMRGCTENQRRRRVMFIVGRPKAG